MANDEPVEAVGRQASARQGMADGLRRIYGDAVLEDPEAVFGGTRGASRSLEQDGRTFIPIRSKYDAYLAGHATLTPAEAAASSCSRIRRRATARSATSASAAMTDPAPIHRLRADRLGVPRNPEIPANVDPTYYDLGLCGPLRTDFRAARTIAACSGRRP